MTYGKKEFAVGDILTTKSGNRYILVMDENGEWGVITGDGPKQIPGLSNYVEFDKEGNLFVSKKVKDNGKVVLVERFDCAPGINRLSEALKMFTGRKYTFAKYIVWKYEDTKKANLIFEEINKLRKQGFTFDEIRAALED